MKGKNILLCAIFIVVTLALATQIALFELEIMSALIFYISSISTFLIWLAFPIIFCIKYYKLKDKVASIQDKYIDDMTPTKPLRFCPTDDQLMQMFKETTAKRQLQQAIEQENETENANSDQNMIGKINTIEEDEMTM